MDHKKYLAEIGRRGGRSGTGAKKIRGDSEYYRQLRQKRQDVKKIDLRITTDTKNT